MILLICDLQVSILGDSLLQNARKKFGGSNTRDYIRGSCTIEELTDDVIKHHSRGGTLNPYCVVMCGVNDIINSATLSDFNQELKKLINYLLRKGYYMLLVTLPLTVSSVMTINNSIPAFNGIIMSYHTKPNISIIPFHKVFKQSKTSSLLLKSIHLKTKYCPVVLSENACTFIKELIEKEIPEYF